MRLWSTIVALVVLACFTTAYAQEAACTDLVQQALKTVDTACAPIGRNQACYGNISILAMPREGTQGFLFDQQGDLAGIADLASLQLQQLDLTNHIWGIALMKVQANLPDTMPGQNVTFLLFGDVRVDNAASGGTSAITVNVTAVESSRVRTGPGPQYRNAGSLEKGQSAPATGRTADSSWLLIQIPDSNALGWVAAGYLSADGDLTTLPVVEAGKQEVPFKPMQAFYFSTGISQSNCAAAPDGILIQTPKGAGKINLRANDADIQLGSTAYLQAQAGGNMTISVLEGQGKVTAKGKTVTVPAGTKVQIPVDLNLKVSGAPGNAQPYDGTVAMLPISLLPDPITIAPPLTVPIYPTWTRAPRQQPTATATSAPPSAATATPAAATDTPVPTATFEMAASPDTSSGSDTLASGNDTSSYGNDTTSSYGSDTLASGNDSTYYGNDTIPTDTIPTDAAATDQPISS